MIHFEVNNMTKKKDKNLNILRTKRAFKMKQNRFFIIFKGFSLKQIKQFFLEGENPTPKFRNYFPLLMLPSHFSLLDENKITEDWVLK